MASLKSQVSCRDERFLSYLAVCIATLIFLQLWIFERKWLQDGRPRDPFQEIYGSSDVVHSPNANAVEIRAATELQGMRQRVRASLLCSSSNYSFPAMMAEVACLRNALSLPDKENCGSSVPWNISTAISKLENLRQETVLLKERLAMLTKSLSERRALTDAERKEAVGSNQQEKMEKLQLVEAHTREIAEMRAKLVAATSFRRLKDSHEPGLTESSHNWFMSSVDGESKDGLPESFDFPADDVHKRLLCLKGNHTFDGSQNFYAFAWKEFLPTSAVLLPGLTFVADNYWDYNNPWHSMSALVYFIFWRSRNGCAVPKRLVLYHWGEVVTDMGPWIGDIMRASLGVDVDVGTMGTSENRPVCFERAVVNRRGLGGMSLENLNTLVDIVRCKARKYCKIDPATVDRNFIQVTLLTRSGARAFSNESGVTAVIEAECQRLGSCQLQVVPISNLSFCEQVWADIFCLLAFFLQCSISSFQPSFQQLVAGPSYEQHRRVHYNTRCPVDEHAFHVSWRGCDGDATERLA